MKGDTGFTLIEVIGSLFIFSLVTLYITDILNLGVTLQEKAQLVVITDHQHQNLRHLMQSHLSQIYPRKNETYVDFIGEKTSLFYIAPALAPMSLDGFYRYKMMEDQNNFVFKWCLLRICPTKQDFKQRAEQSVILKNATQIVWSYGENLNGKVHWTSKWIDRDHLPNFLRLVFEHNGQTEKIIIKPMINMTALCRFDPIARACR